MRGMDLEILISTVTMSFLGSHMMGMTIGIIGTHHTFIASSNTCLGKVKEPMPSLMRTLVLLKMSVLILTKGSRLMHLHLMEV